MNKEMWIHQAAIFYYQIFSGEYEEWFQEKMLQGGGGNSILCGSWMKISANFLEYRISGEALHLLDKLKFPYVKEENTIMIKKNDIKNRNKLFYSNAKTIEKRIEKGKLFHFDHHPSNKQMLSMFKEKVRELNKEDIEMKEKIKIFKNYIKTLQTIDLITIKQDHIRTYADLNNLLSREEREELIEDEWYGLKII